MLFENKLGDLISALLKANKYIAGRVSKIINPVMKLSVFIDRIGFALIAMYHFYLNTGTALIIPTWLIDLFFIILMSSTLYEFHNGIIIMKLPILATLRFLAAPLSELSPKMAFFAFLMAIGIGVLIESFVTSIFILFNMELIKNMKIEELSGAFNNLKGSFNLLIKREAATRLIKPAFSNLEYIMVLILSISSGAALFNTISIPTLYAEAVLSAMGLAIISAQFSLIMSSSVDKESIEENTLLSMPPTLFIYSALTRGTTFKQKLYMILAIVASSILSLFWLLDMPFKIMEAPTILAIVAAASFAVITKLTLHSISPAVRAIWPRKKPLVQNSDVNSVVLNGLTPSKLAIELEDLGILKNLVIAGANLGSKELIYAARNHKVEMFKYLIQEGVQVDVNVFKVAIMQRNDSSASNTMKISSLEMRIYLLARVDFDAPLNLKHLKSCIDEYYEKYSFSAIWFKDIEDAVKLISRVLVSESIQRSFGSYRDLFVFNGKLRDIFRLSLDLTDWVKYFCRKEIKNVSCGLGKLNNEAMPATVNTNMTLKDRKKYFPTINLKNLPTDTLSRIVSYVIDPVLAQLDQLVLGKNLSALDVLRYAQPAARKEVLAEHAAIVRAKEKAYSEGENPKVAAGLSS